MCVFVDFCVFSCFCVYAVPEKYFQFCVKSVSALYCTWKHTLWGSDLGSRRTSSAKSDPQSGCFQVRCSAETLLTQNWKYFSGTAYTQKYEKTQKINKKLVFLIIFTLSRSNYKKIQILIKTENTPNKRVQTKEKTAKTVVQSVYVIPKHVFYIFWKTCFYTWQLPQKLGKNFKKTFFLQFRVFLFFFAVLPCWRVF